MFIAVISIICLFSALSLILFVRVFSDIAPGKSAKNERAKLFAANLDRMSTACVVAALITPQTRLSEVDLGVSETGKTILIFAVFISAAVLLHLIGANHLAKVKD